MQTQMRLINNYLNGFLAALSVCVLAGCNSVDHPAVEKTTTTSVMSAPAAPAQQEAVASVVKAPEAVPVAVRIKAGPGAAFKDAEGNQWIGEQGFTDGDTVERPDIQIANTPDPEIYRSEHYSMTSFSCPVPNGSYTVKLHFAETYEGIQGPGDRVFSFKVQDKEFKDFDVWTKAGGPMKAYVETVNVEVTNGRLEITFTPQVENPQINGIEIIPAT